LSGDFRDGGLLSLWRHKSTNALVSKIFPHPPVPPSVLCSLSRSILCHGTTMDLFLDLMSLLPEAWGPKVSSCGGLVSFQVGPPMFSLTPNGRSRRLMLMSSQIFSLPLCTSSCRLCCSMGFQRPRILYLGSSSCLIDASLVVPSLVALDHVAHSLRHSVARIPPRPGFLSHY